MRRDSSARTSSSGFPHVRADEDDLGSQFFPEGGGESLKRLDGAFSAHPEQTGHADIDLVDQGQVLVAARRVDRSPAPGGGSANRLRPNPGEGRTATSMLFLAALKRACWETKPRNGGSGLES